MCAGPPRYDAISKLMDFNTNVGADHPRRGGVPGTEKVYANRMDLWEYEQCPGPDKCPIGCAHPPNGLEFCFGCVKCAWERDDAKIRRPVELRLLRAAPAELGCVGPRAA